MSLRKTIFFLSLEFVMSLGFIMGDRCYSQSVDREIRNGFEDPAVGVWEWKMAIGPMRKQVSMEVVEREGKLVALITTPEGTKLESKDFARKEDRITFTVRNEEGGKAMTMSHEGRLKGDKMMGTAKMNGGPFDMSIKWDASRLQKKPVGPCSSME